MQPDLIMDTTSKSNSGLLSFFRLKRRSKSKSNLSRADTPLKCEPISFDGTAAEYNDNCKGQDDNAGHEVDPVRIQTRSGFGSLGNIRKSLSYTNLFSRPRSKIFAKKRDASPDISSPGDDPEWGAVRRSGRDLQIPNRDVLATVSNNSGSQRVNSKCIGLDQEPHTRTLANPDQDNTLNTSSTCIPGSIPIPDIAADSPLVQDRCMKVSESRSEFHEDKSGDKLRSNSNIAILDETADQNNSHAPEKHNCDTSGIHEMPKMDCVLLRRSGNRDRKVERWSTISQESGGAIGCKRLSVYGDILLNDHERQAQANCGDTEAVSRRKRSKSVPRFGGSMATIGSESQIARQNICDNRDNNDDRNNILTAGGCHGDQTQTAPQQQQPLSASRGQLSTRQNGHQTLDCIEFKFPVETHQRTCMHAGGLQAKGYHRSSSDDLGPENMLDISTGKHSTPGGSLTSGDDRTPNGEMGGECGGRAKGETTNAQRTPSPLADPLQPPTPTTTLPSSPTDRLDSGQSGGTDRNNDSLNCTKTSAISSPSHETNCAHAETVTGGGLTTQQQPPQPPHRRSKNSTASQEALHPLSTRPNTGVHQLALSHQVGTGVRNGNSAREECSFGGKTASRGSDRHPKRSQSSDSRSSGNGISGRGRRPPAPVVTREQDAQRSARGTNIHVTATTGTGRAGPRYATSHDSGFDQLTQKSGASCATLTDPDRLSLPSSLDTQQGAAVRINEHLDTTGAGLAEGDYRRVLDNSDFELSGLGIANSGVCASRAKTCSCKHKDTSVSHPSRGAVRLYDSSDYSDSSSEDPDTLVLRNLTHRSRSCQDLRGSRRLKTPPPGLNSRSRSCAKVSEKNKNGSKRDSSSRRSRSKSSFRELSGARCDSFGSISSSDDDDPDRIKSHNHSKEHFLPGAYPGFEHVIMETSYYGIPNIRVVPRVFSSSSALESDLDYDYQRALRSRSHGSVHRIRSTTPQSLHGIRPRDTTSQPPPAQARVRNRSKSTGRESAGKDRRQWASLASLSKTSTPNKHQVSMAASAAYIPGVSLSDKLRLAASKGQIDKVRELLSDGASFEPDREGRTAIHYGALNGCAEVVKVLADEGCNVDSQDNLGYTALHRAAAQGHLEVVKILLSEGCKVDQQDEVHGNASLHEAAWNGYSKTLELLSKAKANVHIINKAGFSSLHLAAQNGHNQSARILLYAGCNSDHKNNYGDTPLHTAARYGHAGVTRILISAHCKINEQNKNGDTALHISAALKRRKIAKLVTESGIKTSLKNKQNEQAIDVARRKEHPDIILIITSQPKDAKKKRKQQMKAAGSKFLMDLGEDEEKETTKKEKKGFFFKKKGKSKDKAKPEKPDLKSALEVHATQPSSHPHQHPPAHAHHGNKGPATVPSEISSSDFTHRMHPQDLLRGFRQFQQHQEKGQMAQSTVGSCTAAKGTSTCAASKIKGLVSNYESKPGVQYYRDLAGNVKQGPVGFAPTCQCQPMIKKLEKRIDADRHNIYDHIDATHKTLSEKVEHLDKRCAQQVYSVDKLTKERLEQEHRSREQYIDQNLRRECNHMEKNLDQRQRYMHFDLHSRMDDRLTGFQQRYDQDHKQGTDNRCNYWGPLNEWGHSRSGEKRYHPDDQLNPKWLDNHQVPESAPMPGRLFKSRSDESLASSHHSKKQWRVHSRPINAELALPKVMERAQKLEKRYRSQREMAPPGEEAMKQRPRTFYEGMDMKQCDPNMRRPEGRAQSGRIPEGQVAQEAHGQYHQQNEYRDYMDRQQQWASRRNPISTGMSRELESVPAYRSREADLQVRNEPSVAHLRSSSNDCMTRDRSVSNDRNNVVNGYGVPQRAGANLTVRSHPQNTNQHRNPHQQAHQQVSAQRIEDPGHYQQMRPVNNNQGGYYQAVPNSKSVPNSLGSGQTQPQRPAMAHSSSAYSAAHTRPLPNPPTHPTATQGYVQVHPEPPQAHIRPQEQLQQPHGRYTAMTPISHHSTPQSFQSPPPSQPITSTPTGVTSPPHAPHPSPESPLYTSPQLPGAPRHTHTDSGSNPDSGYGSKLYGHHANGVPRGPPGSTSSSFQSSHLEHSSSFGTTTPTIEGSSIMTGRSDESRLTGTPTSINNGILQQWYEQKMRDDGGKDDVNGHAMYNSLQRQSAPRPSPFQMAPIQGMDIGRATQV